MVRNSRQIVYIYDGKQENGEVVQDFEGDVLIPKKGTLIERNEKRWKVVEVSEERTVAGPKALPIFRIYLQTA